MAGEKYSRSDLVASVAEKANVAQKDAKLVIDCFLDDLKDAIVKDKVVELRGFGTFAVKIRKGREKARNPKTGETVSISDHGAVIFRPGKDLKQDVWNLSKKS